MMKTSAIFGAAMILIGGLMVQQEALAQDKKTIKTTKVELAPKVYQHPISKGQTFRALKVIPKGSKVVHANGERYYRYNGLWYRSEAHGYVRSKAPVVRAAKAIAIPVSKAKAGH